MKTLKFLTKSSFTTTAVILGSLSVSEIDAAVVTSLGAPTSTNTTIGNLSSWNQNGDQQDATFTSKIDFTRNANPADRQVIWESGGGSKGASLIYSGNNTLFFRVKDGGTVSDLSWELTANQLAAGELFVGWVVDLGNDEMRLIMDGLDIGNNLTTVATTSFTGTDWSGRNGAGFGESSSNVGGYTSPKFVGTPFSSGTINTTEGLDFYQDQALMISQVPEPLGTLAGVVAIGFTFFRRHR